MPKLSDAEDRLASHFFPGAYEWGGDRAIDWLEERFALLANR